MQHLKSVKDYHTLKNQLDVKNYQIIKRNPKRAMKTFFRHFLWIKAAGGLVKCEDKVLWMYRLNKWDFPKGKIEKKEKRKSAAIREIKEETGLMGDLNIDHKIMESYHVYFAFEKSVIKKTTWYSIHYQGLKKSIPQASEDITKIKWYKSGDMRIPMSKTYPLIKELVSQEYS